MHVKGLCGLGTVISCHTLMSLWMIPLLCRYASPSSTCFMMAAISTSRKPCRYSQIKLMAYSGVKC